MAHSLESRVLFMDNDLLAFAMQWPVHRKLNNLAEVPRMNENDPRDKQSVYFQKTSDGKQILRDMRLRYIPEDITTKAEKRAFSFPDASWFKGESIDFVKRKLLNCNAAIYQVLDCKALKPLVMQHLNGRQNRRFLI